MTLDEYRIEMGTSSAVADVCANILDDILNEVFLAKDAEREVKAAREAYIAEQHRANDAFNALGRKHLRDREEADELERMLYRKRSAFMSERDRKGDDLDGNFRPLPPVGEDGRHKFHWWVTPEELTLEDWDEVLADRAKKQRREPIIPILGDNETSEVARATNPKLEDFWSERESKGDDLDGNFLRSPPTPDDSYDPIKDHGWWVSEEELRLPTCMDVLRHRADEAARVALEQGV